MKSNMLHNFSEVPTVGMPRSKFHRPSSLKTTFDASKLIPIFIDEALPGDTHTLRTQGFARLSTPIRPILDNAYLETYYFAVPLRLVHDDFKKMMGEQIDPGDSIDYTVPQCTATNISNQTLWDYFGLPTLVANQLSVAAYPFRSMNLIWNEWFRDQNLQDSLDVPKGAGPDAYATYYSGDYPVCKKHDYFTSALPWLQKGDAVQLPIGATAPIAANVTANDQTIGAYDDFNDEDRNFYTNAGTNHLRFENVTSAPDATLYADLSGAAAATINDIREAFQTQKFLEKDARGGTRYTELIKNHFQVTSDDARMQRPEYLGGGSTPIRIQAVPRTDSSPGELGALGVAAFRSHGFTKSFTEHCLIIGLAAVRGDIHYSEGIDRMWKRESRFDFYWPSFAHLGEQSILNSEIYADGTSNDDDVFGYQERYAEYRYKPSKITGKFRSNDPASLDSWHLGVEFGSLPTLDSDFIKDATPIDRVIATPTEPHFIMDMYHDLSSVRPMPVYAIPGYVDHF